MTTALRLKGTYGQREEEKKFPVLPAGASPLATALYGFLLGHIGEGAATPRREFLERAREYFGPDIRITDEHLRMAKEELIEAGVRVDGGDEAWFLNPNPAEGAR